jgi:hypothetical protein
MIGTLALVPPGGFPSPKLTPDGEPCMKGFYPLREDAEKRGKLIKAAGDCHAAPDEACTLIKNYSAAEVKMIEYVETNSGKCGIPAQVAEHLKSGHKNTEGLQNRVCAIAEQVRTRGSGPSLNDVLDPPQTQKRWPLGDYPGGNGRY